MSRSGPPTGHVVGRRVVLTGVTAGLGSALVPSFTASASTSSTIDPAELDPVMAGVIASETSETYSRMQVDYVPRSNMPRNILDPEFGVTPGATSSQTAAIQSALDAYPGAEFFFPAGDYRLDTTLAITMGNTLHLATGARIYAAGAMDQLIVYGNGTSSIRYWDADKGIYGRGLLDGNLLAKDVLNVASTLRFTIGGGLSIKDPIERGLVTGPYGAEFTVQNLRVYNTTNTNFTNSIGIDSYAGDSTFSDIIVRDFTVGAREQGANSWSDFHPWIGVIYNQIDTRYADSVGFWVRGARPTLTNGYMDTFRTQVRVGRSEDGNSSGRALIFNLRTLTGSNAGSLPVQQANPGTIFDVGMNCIVDSYYGIYNTAPNLPMSFLTGETTRTTVVGVVPDAAITGYHDYEKGTVVGNATWTPRLAGGNIAGEHAYAMQRGHMNVSREGLVTWSFQVKATLDSTLAGSFRLVDVPFPAGAASLRIAPMGAVGFSSTNLAATALYAGTWGPGATGSVVIRRGTADVDGATLRGQVVELYGTFSAPYNTLVL